MLTLFKWLFRLLVAGMGILLAGLVLAYYLASHSLPDYSLERAVPKLDTPVEIVRDSYAVPHIFAETDTGVLYGLGFAHAQDRLWQMTMLRRVAQG